MREKKKKKNDIVGQQRNIYIDNQLTSRSPRCDVEKDEKSRFAQQKTITENDMFET